MFLLARHSLLRDPVRFAVTLIGITFALVLIIQFNPFLASALPSALAWTALQMAASKRVSQSVA